MDYRRRVGNFGETLAKNYLKKHGYRIVGSNIKTSFQEIDIVAELGENIIFVEVKTRISQRFGSADEAMDPPKLNNFNKAIELFLISQNIESENIQADLISIDISRAEKMAKIKHYKNII